jgi:hypothetical protein
VRDDGRVKQPSEPEIGGVLSGLPTTRPQRRSPKRATTTAAAAVEPRAVRRRSPSPTLGAGGAAAGSPPMAAQGFEPDGAPASVEPPSRADLLGSVVGGAGELAHVGLDVGRHVLRSVLGRLTR